MWIKTMDNRMVNMDLMETIEISATNDVIDGKKYLNLSVTHCNYKEDIDTHEIELYSAIYDDKEDCRKAWYLYDRIAEALSRGDKLFSFNDALIRYFRE